MKVRIIKACQNGRITYQANKEYTVKSGIGKDMVKQGFAVEIKDKGKDESGTTKASS